MRHIRVGQIKRKTFGFVVTPASRLPIFLVLFASLFFVLIAKLFYWQVLQGKVLSAQARNQYEYRSGVTAPRGNILASDASWLSAASRSWTIAISIREMESDKKREISESLAPLFLKASGITIDENETVKEREKKIEDEENRIYSLITRDKIVWTPLKSRVPDEIKKEIDALDIKGIHYEPEETRIYPEASTAAHILGFVGKDENGANQGYFGLEGFYDKAMTGKDGFVSREADPLGAPILLGENREVRAIAGVDLLTYIDKSIQINLDKRLKEGIERYGAKAGTAIIMEPQTGAIVGMSSFPSYDPAKYWEFGDTYFSNPAVSSTFEPGSIFKVLIMAAGLDAKVIRPDSTCDICGAPYKIDKYLIETWNREYTPNSTMTNVIVHSDNVGMVFVANRLGKERMYDYIQKFGVGESTGIDLQGEAVAPLRDFKSWGPVEHATASFGQGVAVTPIQMVRAVGALANRGIMVRPHVVHKLVGQTWEEDITKSHEGVRVISEEASSDITQMMAEAARNGESKWTYLKGFRVAGKTGTAQIAINGYYDETNTIASFIGFAPYDDPKFVMLVTLKEPQTSQWASETAAPLWYAVAKDLFLHYGIQPQEQPSE